MNELEIKKVPFLGTELMAARDADGQIWAGVRWVCEGIGLSEGQTKNERLKIQKDKVLSKGGRNFVLNEGGYGNREVLCLKLDFIPLWLAKIAITPTMEQETPELAATLEQYQLRAKDVLAEAFLPKKPRGNNGQAPKLPPLSSVNMAMKLTTDAMKAAGVAPEYIVETAKNTYKPYGIIVPDDCITTQEHFMSQTEIAKRLGVMTKASGGKNPSASAVGGIIAQIGVEDREVKNAPFAKNGHSGDSKLYAESVAERVGAWLRDNEYPAAIKGRDGKNQRVVYDVRPGQ